MFHVGQLVVCINTDWDTNRSDYGKMTYPEKGMIYTIRDIKSFASGTGMRLEEIINKPLQYKAGLAEPSFLIERFRPLKKTSIDCFTALLNPTPELEDA